MTQTVLITGSNRGIGLSLSQLYKSKAWNVIALCRSKSEALEALNVEVHTGMDVSSPDIAGQLTDILKDRPLDLLINNAGILRNEVLGTIDYKQVQEQWEVNTLGPLRVAEACLKNLKAGSKIAMITSRMGSIADNSSGGRYGYRMSKAALNMASVSLAADLKTKEVPVGIYHPGLVGTDMIGGKGNLTPEEAAESLHNLIDGLNLENSGKFWHINGENLAW